MNTPYHLMIHSLLTRFHKEDANSLFKFFASEDESELSKTHVPQKPPVLQITEGLSNIHYSWLPPFLAKYPINLKNLIISSLPSSLLAGITKLAKPPIKKIPLSPFARFFFLKYFYQEWLPEDVVAIEFLEENPLNTLLHLTKLQLVSLVDFLGIQDLSIDLRKVVDKKTLDILKNLLSAHQKQYLDYCLKRADVPPVKPEPVQYWMQSKEKLALLIHQKGLARLAHALLGQNSHLIWHIIHRLDIGRGKELTKCLDSPTDIPKKLSSQITSEVLDLVKLLNKGKE
ncbi:MAG: hypothetical protein P4L16_05925 [Chlamydiales bacterium]|nr:hypothetical protein [Chlamydiales bacterium]